MKGFESLRDGNGHEKDHHCRHGSDTSNFVYLGDSVKDSPSNVGFLGAGRCMMGDVLGVLMGAISVGILWANVGTNGLSLPLG